ncbi:MAG TPA: cytochrome P450 [Candidatus Acidoferrum sp.]|nr:cytochrome P450 [Candidatus Acidoferrum sp.]
MMNRNQIAPGPRGDLLTGNLRAFRRDVLGLMLESARKYGDVVRFRIGPIVVHLLNHPDHVEHVLQSHARNYDKATRSSSKIRLISGESLLTSNGEFWQRRRRLLQPSFHRQGIAKLASQMKDLTAEMLERWQTHLASGQPLDVASEVMHLTCTIVGKTLLGADVGGDLSAVEDAMGTILAHTFQSWGNIINLPPFIPTPGNLRFRGAMQILDNIVYRIIAEHRSGKIADRDLLSMLLDVCDEHTHEGLSDSELRNEAITFLLAGHETTANALSWTFYLLSQNPGVERQLRAELSGVPEGAPSTVEHFLHLKSPTMVIQEAMRLYPPIWAMERRAIAADEIGGFHIPAGSSVVISPYVLHRNEKFWPNAERFDPTRFTAKPQGYIPFGSGLRFCIGAEFAMMEARLIVPMVLQACHLELVPSHSVEPLPGITLRPKNGLQMTVHPPVP